MARDNQEAIRDWMSAALAHSGMSQADLAREVWDGDRSIPNKIMKGRREVRVDELAQIEQATGYVPFTPMVKNDARPLRPPPDRAKRKLHIAEWREHSEIEPAVMAKSLGMDEDTYGFMESRPHKFTIEQAEAAAKKMKIQFDQLWFAPSKIEAAPKATQARKVQRK